MRQANSAGKVALAVISLLLTVLIWERGLEESFSRPSVSPKLSLRQQEMSVLATPSIPQSIKPVLLGSAPEEKLQKALREIPLEELGDRERLLLASLETSQEKRLLILEKSFHDETFQAVQENLLTVSKDGENNNLGAPKPLQIVDDPLLQQSICLANGESLEVCSDSAVSKSMAFRLLFSQGIPALATFLGIGLLLRQSWLMFRQKGTTWPPLVSLPLSLLDMTLLVAGGFVVLGEVVLPTLISPASELLTRGIASPLSDSLRVFVGYTVMTIPPLLILRQQIKGIDANITPDGGWIQWRFIPFGNAFTKAFSGWLMVLPLVLLTSWLMTSFVGDQGGSNPLLDLVLRSQNPLALLLLIMTTVIFAPLFEELIFRGVLLPVLVRSIGRNVGVIVSALVFALAHLSVGEFPPLVVLGLGLAFLRLSSGRLFPCVLMHSLWNGVTFASLLLLG